MKRAYIIALSILCSVSGITDAQSTHFAQDVARVDEAQIRANTVLADTTGQIFVEFRAGTHVLDPVTQYWESFEILPPQITEKHTESNPQIKMRHVLSFELTTTYVDRMIFTDEYTFLSEQEIRRLENRAESEDFPHFTQDDFRRSPGVKVIVPLEWITGNAGIWHYDPESDIWQKIGGITSIIEDTGQQIFTAYIYETGLYSIFDENPLPDPILGDLAHPGHIPDHYPFTRRVIYVGPNGEVLADFYDFEYSDGDVPTLEELNIDIPPIIDQEGYMAFSEKEIQEIQEQYGDDGTFIIVEGGETFDPRPGKPNKTGSSFGEIFDEDLILDDDSDPNAPVFSDDILDDSDPTIPAVADNTEFPQVEDIIVPSITEEQAPEIEGDPAVIIPAVPELTSKSPTSSPSPSILPTEAQNVEYDLQAAITQKESNNGGLWVILVLGIIGGSIYVSRTRKKKPVWDGEMHEDIAGLTQDENQAQMDFTAPSMSKEEPSSPQPLNTSIPERSESKSTKVRFTIKK